MKEIELVHLKCDIEQKQALLNKNLKEYVRINSRFNVGDIIEDQYGRVGKIFSMNGNIFISAKKIQINAIGFLITDSGVLTDEKFIRDQDRCELWG